MSFDLLHVLTQQLDSVPRAVIEGVCFPQRPREAAKWIEANERDGMVATYRRMVGAEFLFPVEPIHRGAPGTPLDCSAVSYRLKHRFENPPRAETFVCATRKAKRIYGGHHGGRETRVTDTDHDFVLALAFFSLPERLRRKWLSERWLSANGWSFGGDTPDALLRGRGPRDHVLIEVGGSSYRPEKLLARDTAWAEWSYLLY